MSMRFEAVKTLITIPDVGRALQRAAIERDEPLSVASVLVLLAQFALETGRGKSCYNFNLGNVKAATPTVEHVYFYCNEILSPKEANRLLGRAARRSDGSGLLDTAVNITASTARTDGRVVVDFWPDSPVTRFRRFASLDDGALFYFSFLRDRYTKAWTYVLAGDPRAFVAALKASNYFTADEAKYAAAVLSLVAEFSKIDFSDLVAADPVDYAKVDEIIDAVAVMNLVALTLQEASWDAINDSFREHGRDDA